MRRPSEIIKELPNPYSDLLMNDLVSDKNVKNVKNLSGLFMSIDRFKRHRHVCFLDIIFHTETLGNKCINWDSNGKEDN